MIGIDNAMARIYDNIEVKFTEGLQGIISNVGVKRIDFCVGYFNLRGWNLIVNQVDELPGDYVYENDDRKLRICRLLIGMHRPDEDLIRSLYSKHDDLPDDELDKDGNSTGFSCVMKRLGRMYQEDNYPEFNVTDPYMNQNNKKMYSAILTNEHEPYCDECMDQVYDYLYLFKYTRRIYE